MCGIIRLRACSSSQRKRREPFRLNGVVEMDHLFLILDDEHERIRRFKQKNVGATIHAAYTADEAIKLLEERQYGLIMLDHDLAEEHYQNLESFQAGTGMEVVKWLGQNKEVGYNPTIVVHSMNPYAGPKMVEILKSAGFHITVHLPGGWDKRYISKSEEA
jgi:vacuolar-type H+-ATPase subunit F/Vma7